MACLIVSLCLGRKYIYGQEIGNFHTSGRLKKLLDFDGFFKKSPNLLRSIGARDYVDSGAGGLFQGLIRSACLVPWSVPMSVRLCLSA